MNKMFKYQTYDIGKGLGIYCLVIIILFGISGIVAMIYPDNFSTISNTGMSNFIFSFLIGLCVYKEHWLFGMQNGISRKEFFKSCLVVGIVFNMGISLFDLFINKIFLLIFGSLDNFVFMNFLEIFYREYCGNKNEMSLVIINILFEFLATITFFILGILIAAVFLRIPKRLRTFYAIALPVSIFGILPILGIFFPNFFVHFAMMFLKIMGMQNGAQNPMIACLTLTIMSIIFALCGYGLLRKTEV